MKHCGYIISKDLGRDAVLTPPALQHLCSTADTQLDTNAVHKEVKRNELFQ